MEDITIVSSGLLTHLQPCRVTSGRAIIIMIITVIITVIIITVIIKLYVMGRSNIMTATEA